MLGTCYRYVDRYWKFFPHSRNKLLFSHLGIDTTKEYLLKRLFHSLSRQFHVTVHDCNKSKSIPSERNAEGLHQRRGSRVSGKYFDAVLQPNEPWINRMRIFCGEIKLGLHVINAKHKGTCLSSNGKLFGISLRMNVRKHYWKSTWKEIMQSL